MTEHTLLVCSLCRFSENQNKKHGLSGGQHLIQELEKGLEKYEWRDLTYYQSSLQSGDRRLKILNQR